MQKIDPALVPTITLNTGSKIPVIGLGTFGSDNYDALTVAEGVKTAIRMGYRHIDTAHAYNDEAGVGRAVKESGIPREEIWITSKLWPTEYGEGKTLKAIDEMLERMQLEYIDLLYVHQPVGDFVGAWKDMEKAVAMGKVRALGISNFRQRHIDALLKTARVLPVANQIRLCPGDTQEDTVNYSREKGMLLQAYSPLGTCL